MTPFALAIVLAPTPARAEEPSTGTPFIVSGSLLAGVGVLDLATSPWCASSKIAPDGRPVCAVVAVSSGVALTGVGVALLAVGAMQRGRWLEHVRVAPSPTGLMVGWGASW